MLEVKIFQDPDPTQAQTLRRRRGKREMFDVLTSTTSAESSIPVAAGDADSDNLAVHVLGLVRVDVAGTAAAVRNFGSRHGWMLSKIPQRVWLSSGW